MGAREQQLIAVVGWLMTAISALSDPFAPDRKAARDAVAEAQTLIDELSGETHGGQAEAASSGSA